ncbi:ROK family protein [Sphingomonas adhaesiva]|uniref:ROK family protein n=1 Tax=Sphingomonas adhaesiva TaxID=28212 RepID=UPI002FF8E28F
MGRDGRVAGVELGGTKCIAVLATPGGDILEQHTVVTGDDPPRALGELSLLLDRWWHDGGFDALGVASFGPVQLDPAAPDYGAITATAKPGWRDTAVLGPLSARYDVPAAFDTDVNGAALAEGRWGAAQGLDDFAYVTVGTGVGVGLIVNGRATRGLGHCEAGHMRIARVPGDDFPGACPYHGDCVEGLAAGPAILKRLGVPGETVAADHPVWDLVADALAQMVQALVSSTAPRRFLLGGGVLAQRPDLIARVDSRVRDLIGDYLTLPATDFIVAPGLGTKAGPLGPIALALQ